jgi:hypothetical protein
MPGLPRFFSLSVLTASIYNFDWINPSDWFERFEPSKEDYFEALVKQATFFYNCGSFPADEEDEEV